VLFSQFLHRPTWRFSLANLAERPPGRVLYLHNQGERPVNLAPITASVQGSGPVTASRQSLVAAFPQCREDGRLADSARLGSQPPGKLLVQRKNEHSACFSRLNPERSRCEINAGPTQFRHVTQAKTGESNRKGSHPSIRLPRRLQVEIAARV